MISEKIKDQILSVLKTNTDEMSSSEIQKTLNYNRTTITKYLQILHTSGHITFKHKGMAKVWSLSESPVIALFSETNTSTKKNYLTGLFNMLEDTGVRIVDKNNNTLWINNTLSSWIGDISLFKNKSCNAIYTSKNNHVCPAQKTLNTGKHSTSQTIINTCFGKLMDVEINSYALEDKNGNIYGVMQFFKDITEKRTLEKQTSEYTDRLEQKIDETSRMLSILHTITYSASKIFKKDEFLQKVMNDILYLMHVSMGMIYIIDKKTNKLELKINHGLSKEYIKDCINNPPIIGNGLVGNIAKTGELIYIKDNASDDLRIARNLTKKENLNTFIGIPLKTKDSILGVLVIASKEKRVFRPHEIDILVAITNQVALALENASLFKKTKESKKLYESLMDASPDAVALIGINSKIIQASKRALDMFKTTKNNFIGKNAFDFIAKKDKEKAMINFKKAIDEGFLYGAEYDLLIGDGTTIIGETNGIYMKDAGGNIQGILTTIRDITERKKIEKKLSERELRYRLLFENATDAIFILSTNKRQIGRILDINQSAANMYGYTVKELLNLNIRNLDDEKTKKESKAHFSRLFAGENIVAEIKHVKKDGTTFPVEINASLIEIDNTKYILAINRDISKRKKAEKNLKDAKNYLETVIQMSYDGIFVVDKNGCFEFCNDATYNILGWPKKELIGKHFLELIPKKLHDFMKEKFKEVQNKQGKPYETEIIRNNGKIRNLLVSHKDMVIEDRIKYCVVIKDITERKKIESQKAFLATIIENSSDAIISMNLNYTITSWNSAAEKLLGFNQNEVLGKNILEKIVPKELKIEREKLIYIASKNGTASIKTKRYTKEGLTISVILTISPIYDDIKMLVGYSTILKDLRTIK